MEQSSKMALPRKVRLGAFRPRRRLPFVLLMQLSLLVLACCALGAFWPEGRNTVPSADSGKTLDLFESRYRSAKALSAVFLEQFSDNGKLVRKEAGEPTSFILAGCAGITRHPKRTCFSLMVNTSGFIRRQTTRPRACQQGKARTGARRLRFSQVPGSCQKSAPESKRRLARHPPRLAISYFAAACEARRRTPARR